MQKLYVIGDSISIQYGPYLAQALQGRMAYARKEGEAEARLNPDNPQGAHGDANGGDSGMVLEFLHASDRAGGIEADLLLLNCGLHDIKTDPTTGQKQVSLNQYRNNLEAIIALVAQMRPALVWIRTTPCDESIHNHPGMSFHRFSADNRAYNRAADHIMAAANIPTIDLYTFTLNLVFCQQSNDG